jgi:hypothetical protein
MKDGISELCDKGLHLDGCLGCRCSCHPRPQSRQAQPTPPLTVGCGAIWRPTDDAA